MVDELDADPAMRPYAIELNNVQNIGDAGRLYKQVWLELSGEAQIRIGTIMGRTFHAAIDHVARDTTDRNLVLRVLAKVSAMRQVNLAKDADKKLIEHFIQRLEPNLAPIMHLVSGRTAVPSYVDQLLT